VDWRENGIRISVEEWKEVLERKGGDKSKLTDRLSNGNCEMRWARARPCVIDRLIGEFLMHVHSVCSHLTAFAPLGSHDASRRSTRAVPSTLDCIHCVLRLMETDFAGSRGSLPDAPRQAAKRRASS
jgi:hypothetical protein